MNNEEKITALIDTMHVEIKQMNRQLDNLEAKMEKLNYQVQNLNAQTQKFDALLEALKKDTEAIFDHVVSLKKLQAEADQAVENLVAITKENTYDILKLKAAR